MTKGVLLPEILPLAVGHMTASLPRSVPLDSDEACVWSNMSDVTISEMQDDLSQMLGSKLSGCRYEKGYKCQLTLSVEESRRPRFHLHSGRSFSAWSNCLTQLVPDVVSLTAEAFVGRERAIDHVTASLDFTSLALLAEYYTPGRRADAALESTTFDTSSFQLAPGDGKSASNSSFFSTLIPWGIDDENGLETEASLFAPGAAQHAVHKARDIDFEVSDLFRELPFYRPLIKRLWQRRPTDKGVEGSEEPIETLVDVFYQSQMQPLLEISNRHDIDVLLHRGKEAPLRARRAKPINYYRRPRPSWLRHLTAQPVIMSPLKASVAVLGHGAVSLKVLASDIGVNLPYSLVGRFGLTQGAVHENEYLLQYRVDPLLHPFPLAFSNPVWFAAVWSLGQRRMVSCIWLLAKAVFSGMLLVAFIALVLDWVERCSGSRELTAAEEEAQQRKKRLEEKRRPQEVSYSKKLASFCIDWARPVTRFSPLATTTSILCHFFVRVIKTLKSLVFFILSFEELLAASSLTLLLDTVLPITLGRVVLSLAGISPWLQLPAEWSAWHLNENFVVICVIAHCIGIIYLNIVAAIVFNAFEVIQVNEFFCCSILHIQAYVSNTQSTNINTHMRLESHKRLCRNDWRSLLFLIIIPYLDSSHVHLQSWVGTCRAIELNLTTTRNHRCCLKLSGYQELSSPHPMVTVRSLIYEKLSTATCRIVPTPPLLKSCRRTCARHSSPRPRLET